MPLRFSVPSPDLCGESGGLASMMPYLAGPSPPSVLYKSLEPSLESCEMSCAFDQHLVLVVLEIVGVNGGFFSRDRPGQAAQSVPYRSRWHPSMHRTVERLPAEWPTQPRGSEYHRDRLLNTRGGFLAPVRPFFLRSSPLSCLPAVLRSCLPWVPVWARSLGLLALHFRFVAQRRKWRWLVRRQRDQIYAGGFGVGEFKIDIAQYLVESRGRKENKDSASPDRKLGKSCC